MRILRRLNSKQKVTCEVRQRADILLAHVQVLRILWHVAQLWDNPLQVFNRAIDGFAFRLQSTRI